MSEPSRQVTPRTWSAAAAFPPRERPRRRQAARAATTLALLALVAACAARPPKPPPPPLLVTGPLCLSTLSQQRIAFERVTVGAGRGACAVENAVRVDRLAIPWNRPAVLSCTLAAALDRFERESVQTLALRHLGQPVARIHQLGSYDCRRENGGRPGRWSQHASGNAIDIGAFELSDGTVIKVAEGWSARGPRRDFLREVARSACQHFMVVLTPDGDGSHADHFHFDVGPYRLCQ